MLGSQATLVMTLGDTSEVYVRGKVDEADIGKIKEGQKATFTVDAFPDQVIEGRLDSFAPASGAKFSLLPPENATGNFTKIVQRLPVKITLTPGQDLVRLLRIGFSVETTIDTGLADVAARQQGTPARISAR